MNKRNWIRRLLTLPLIALATFGASIGVGVGTAAACPLHHTCIHDGTSFTGSWNHLLDSNQYFHFNMSDGADADERTSSVETDLFESSCRSILFQTEKWNYNYKYIWFYERGSSRGSSEDPYLANGGGSGPHRTQNMNNIISSNLWVASC